MQIPRNIEAEKALLGAFLILGEIPPASSVDVEDFYIEKHADIFNAMRHAAGVGAIDIISVTAELERSGKLENIGGMSYLAGLVNECENSTLWWQYESAVVEAAKKRRYLQLAQKIATMARDGEIDEIANVLREQIEESDDQGDDWSSQFIPHEDLIKPPEPTEWIITQYVSRGSLSIWFGAPGSKKSYILADAAVCVSNGVSWLESALIDGEVKPLNGIHTSKTNVLWIDLDNGRRVTRNRFSALLYGHNVEPNGLFPVSMPLPWPFMDRDEPVEYLYNTIMRNDIGLVIIDNLGHITGDVDENSAEMAKVMSRLRRIVDATGAAIIIIHHARKNGSAQRVADALRGSSAVEAALDFAFYIERNEDDPNLAVIKAAKIREGKWAKPLTVAGLFISDDASDGNEILRSVAFYQTAQAVIDRKDAVLIALLRAINEVGGSGTRAVRDYIRENWDFDDKTISNTTIQSALTKAKSQGLVTTKKNGRTKQHILTLSGRQFLELNDE